MRKHIETSQLTPFSVMENIRDLNVEKSMLLMAIQNYRKTIEKIRANQIVTEKNIEKYKENYRLLRQSNERLFHINSVIERLENYIFKKHVDTYLIFDRITNKPIKEKIIYIWKNWISLLTILPTPNSVCDSQDSADSPDSQD